MVYLANFVYKNTYIHRSSHIIHHRNIFILNKAFNNEEFKDLKNTAYFEWFTAYI